MEKIDISHRTIIFTVCFLIGVWLIYQIRFVILLLFVSFILMTALNPIVSSLQRIKTPRTLAIFITFILAISLIVLIFSGIVPPFIEETLKLAKNIDNIFPANDFIDSSLIKIDEQFIASQISTISQSAVNVFKLAIGAFSNLFTLFSLIVLTFYLLMERGNLKKYLTLFWGEGTTERRSEELIDNVESQLGGWVRGELALMFIVGVLSYIGLTILGIPFALPLALFADLMELIPNVGPTISAIPAILMGFTISPAIALGALILYLAVQQLENNIFVPMVMKQSVGLNPLTTLLALMIGLTLGGVIGAILAVPTLITLQVILKHIYKYRKTK